MTDETPRLNLKKFEQGDTDWDHSDTVDAVDEQSIERAPISERPEEGEYDDELFHAIDQRITWRWDAGEEDWKYFSGLGSADARMPGMVYRESVDVEDLNSVRYVDDTWTAPDINDLISTLSNNGGGTVIFEKGTYELSEDGSVSGPQPGAIHARDNVDLIGQGYDTHLQIQDQANIIVVDEGEDNLTVRGIDLTGTERASVKPTGTLAMNSLVSTSTVATRTLQSKVIGSTIPGATAFTRMRSGISGSSVTSFSTSRAVTQHTFTQKVPIRSSALNGALLPSTTWRIVTEESTLRRRNTVSRYPIQFETSATVTASRSVVTTLIRLETKSSTVTAKASPSLGNEHSAIPTYSRMAKGVASSARPWKMSLKKGY